MKRFFLPTLGLALLLSLPAISQDEAPTLEEQVKALTKKVEEQGAALQELTAYVERQKAQAKKLEKSLSEAEEQGFLLPAPNNEAKKALLGGLQEFAGVAAGGESKPASDEG